MSAVEAEARALSLRLFSAGLASAELMTCYLGLRLGLYELLAADHLTYEELAGRARIDPRYAREWLEQQAAAGLIDVDRPELPADHRRFGLGEAHRTVLLDPDSPHYMAALTVRPVGAMSSILDRLVDAMREGDGIPYADYGPDMRGGDDGLNRYTFVHRLPGWLEEKLPELHADLSGRPVRIADIGCGTGWSTISLAETYPEARVDGIDLDAESIEGAKANAAAERLSDRVRFIHHNGADDGEHGAYDLVCVFDALHDMARPVDVLESCRRRLGHGGSMILLEPGVGERFTAPAPESERLQYAISVLHCLPVGLADQPSAATGTVMRPATVRRYARDAGFGRVKVIDVDQSLHRLYHLLPG